MGFKMRISTVLKRFLCWLFIRLSNSYLLARFIASGAGKEYGIGRLHKLKLARRIKRNNRTIESLTTWQQHLILVEEILRLPKSLRGDVVECGCYNGASTVNLSLACGLVNRSLIVCDSFEGLPNPKIHEKFDIHADSIDYYIWEEGEFSSEGGLNGVKKNVENFGNIKVCQFVKGLFKDTLKDINTDSIVLVFEDADIASSVEDCLRCLWPKLQEGCKFYCHEPWSINVVSLFYDKEWWENNLGTHPPGFWGSGDGMIAGLGYSAIGYAKKFSAEKIKEHGTKRVHLGSKGFTE